MFKGSFPASIFFKGSSYLIAGTIFIIYWIAQTYQHEHPFPNCWISKLAQHYPEYIYFRVGTISGSVLLILGWFTNYFYLKTICKENAFNLNKYHPQVVLVLGMMGSMLLMGSTANIDTGKMNGHWHSTCASNFFIITLITQFLNTIMYAVLSTKIKSINHKNLLFKYFLILLVVIQYIVSVLLGYFEELSQDSGFTNVQQFLEWSLTLTVVLGFYSIGVDAEDFAFVYESNSRVEERSMQETD